MGACAVGAAALVTSVVLRPPDVLVSLVGSLVGAAIGAAIVTSLTSLIPARYRYPQPWPPGAIAEPSERSVSRTVVLTVTSAAAVIAVFVVTARHVAELFPAWTGIYLALGGTWWLRQRRLAQLESELKITIYRDLASRRRPRTSRQSYARQ